MPIGPAFALQRFVDAQQATYPAALAELRQGRKQGHWMWFVFPQLKGLGSSSTALRYGIEDAAQARAYLCHPVLGPRLLECVQALLAQQGVPVVEMLGHVDALKLRSCLTLFAAVAPDPAPFETALDRLYGGTRDPRTLSMLAAPDA